MLWVVMIVPLAILQCAVPILLNVMTPALIRGPWLVHLFNLSEKEKVETFSL